jgi:hypothetical protein
MQFGAPPPLPAGSEALLERLAATSFARADTTADFTAGARSAVDAGPAGQLAVALGGNEAQAPSPEIVQGAARFPQPPGYEVLDEIGRGAWAWSIRRVSAARIDWWP